MTTESKTLAHNRKLCAAYIATSKVFSRYPRVSEQLECVPFDSTTIHKFAYNPSLIEFKATLYMAYRWQNHIGEQTRIALAVLDNNFRIVSVHEIIGAEIMGDYSMEDPKLFEFDGKLMISFVSSKFPKTMQSVVRYAFCPMP